MTGDREKNTMRPREANGEPDRGKPQSAERDAQPDEFVINLARSQRAANDPHRAITGWNVASSRQFRRKS